MADQKLTELPIISDPLVPTDEMYVVRDDVSYQLTLQQILDVIPQSGAIWGQITGTLSDQTDLQDEFNATNGAVAGLASSKADKGPIENSGLSIDTMKLAGRYTAGTGDLEEIGLGAGLSVVGSDLQVTVDWGDIGGTLADQTDLQAALDAKAPKGAVGSSGLTMFTSRLLGRTTGSTGAIEEITAGFGLLFASGIVSVNPAIPQVLFSADATFAVADAGYDFVHNPSDANPRTLTIPANASIPIPVGTVIFITNWAAGIVTLAITTDTLIWGTGGSPQTGSRTLAFWATVAIKKVTSTYWVLTGVGIS